MLLTPVSFDHRHTLTLIRDSNHTRGQIRLLTAMVGATDSATGEVRLSQARLAEEADLPYRTAMRHVAAVRHLFREHKRGRMVVFTWDLCHCGIPVSMCATHLPEVAHMPPEHVPNGTPSLRTKPLGEYSPREKDSKDDVPNDDLNELALGNLNLHETPPGVSPAVAAESGRTPPPLSPRSNPRNEHASMTALDTVLDKVERKHKITSGWIASCPVSGHGQGHGDRNPSLSISVNADGAVLLNCQSGCHVQDVLLALGLDYPDLFDEPITRDLGVKVAEWTYTDDKGSPWFIAERWQTATGKRFVQRKPGAEYAGLGSGFFYCLYRLPQVIETAKAGGEVWLVEGEKCVHAALTLGLCATTAPLGAGKWRHEYNRWLLGASCVNIVIDNDPVGREHARKVQASLAESGIVTKVWRTAIADTKTDLYDHIAAGYGLDDLKPTRLDITVPTTWGYRKARTTVFPERQWVIENVLPTGMCLLSGASKIGKSVLGVGMSLCVGSGDDWLKRHHVRQGAVLHLGLDNEGMRDLVSRFAAAERFYGIHSLNLPIEMDEGLHEDVDGESAIGEVAQQMIRGWHAARLEEGDTPRLVVVDTLSKIEPNYEGDGRGSDYLRSTSVLSSWAKMAMELDIALVAIHHSTKSEEGSWVNRGFMGSRGLTATAHTLMFLDAKHGAKEGTLRITGRHVPTEDYPLVREGMQWVDEIYASQHPYTGIHLVT